MFASFICQSAVCVCRTSRLLSGYRRKENTTRRAGVGRGGDDLSLHFFFSVFFSSSHSSLYSIRTTCISELPLFILNRAVDIPLYMPPKYVSLISYPQVPLSCKLRHDIFFQTPVNRINLVSTLEALCFSFPCFTWSEDYYSESPQSVNSLKKYSTIPVRALIETWVPISV